MSNEKQFSQGFTPNLPLWSFQFQKDSKLALKTRKDLEIHLITRALKDESFRAELIANPKAVIEQEIGSKLPDELEIMVLEETEDTIYMVLPCNPYEGLSEEELKASLGMSYEDVALWVLEQQRNTLLDEESSVKLIVQSWTDEAFEQKLVDDPILLIERALGEEIQTNMKIQVILETSDSICMTLPHLKEETSFNLDKDDVWMSTINMPMVVAGCPSGETQGCSTTPGFSSLNCNPGGSANTICT